MNTPIATLYEITKQGNMKVFNNFVYNYLKQHQNSRLSIEDFELLASQFTFDTTLHMHFCYHKITVQDVEIENVYVDNQNLVVYSRNFNMENNLHIHHITIGKLEQKTDTYDTIELIIHDVENLSITLYLCIPTYREK